MKNAVTCQQFLVDTADVPTPVLRQAMVEALAVEVPYRDPEVSVDRLLTALLDHRQWHGRDAELSLGRRCRPLDRGGIS